MMDYIVGSFPIQMALAVFFAGSCVAAAIAAGWWM